MRTITYIISIYLLFVTCKSNTMYDAPKDLIPRDTMVMLLKDIYVSIASKNFRNLNGERYQYYGDLIYLKYQIDSTRFSRSNIYYTSKIIAYETMLKQAKRELDSMHGQLKLLDSIKKKNDTTRQKPKIKKIKTPNN